MKTLVNIVRAILDYTPGPKVEKCLWAFTAAGWAYAALLRLGWISP